MPADEADPMIEVNRSVVPVRRTDVLPSVIGGDFRPQKRMPKARRARHHSVGAADRPT